MSDPAMTGPAAATAPRRGRPRSEKARQAILHAAAELLLNHGLGAVSMRRRCSGGSLLKLW